MKEYKLIKKITEELFRKMTFSKVAVKIKKQEESPVLVISVQVKDPSQLIGHNGFNLKDIQRILRMLVIKKDPQAPNLLLDINNYRDERESFLKELGQKMAEQVIETKKSVILQPMSSYDRRIIHLELANKDEIITESIGEEPMRRLVIKPQP